jgi:mono/diheme cytochrome c family protein
MRRAIVVAALVWFVNPLAAARLAPVNSQLPTSNSRSSPALPFDRDEVVAKYCVTCHNEKTKTGGLALDVVSRGSVRDHAPVWEDVLRKLRAGAMPPPGMPRLDAAAAAALMSSLATELDRAPRDPGRPLLRRLNRAEYGNVIRDLLALDVDVRSLLPADDSAFGFDNNADLQAVSPALLERYLTAADKVSALAVGDPATVPAAENYFTRGDQSQSQHQDGLPLGTVGGIGVRHYFPLDGEYQFQVALIRTNTEGIRGLEHTHQLEITVDGTRVFLGAVGGDAETAQGGVVTDRSDATDARLRVRVPVKAGSRLVAAAWIRKIGEGTNRLRPFLRSNAGTYDSTGRPHVKMLTIAGPFNPTGPGDTRSRRRIFTCHPAGPPLEALGLGGTRPTSEEACARRILTTLARGAYRRPLRTGEIDTLLAFYRDGRKKGTFETGIQLALRRLLASPSFVFRAEDEPGRIPNPKSQNPNPNLVAGAFAVNDHELATRLSFFLWSSMPDETLSRLAEQGQLRRPAVLEAQVRRMIADPRADAMLQNFAGQWLHVRNLQNAAPNTDEFPDFDNDLRDGLRREIELFFGAVLREDRPVLDLLTADYTFVNERLAKHYGIPHVYGSQFRRVTLAEDARRGLLGKGSILLATSHADRTAPVLRGKWILENLLGTPPPPPPADVPALEPAPGRVAKTMRERMAIHREDPACAGCHRVTDPVGFVLENFDAVGAWRVREAGAPVDATGLAPDGTAVNGVVELRQALLRHQDAFVFTLIEKLMIYALGRGLESYDMPVVREIVRDAGREDYRVSSLLLGIVKSVPFQMRRKGSGVISSRTVALARFATVLEK